MIFQKKNLQCFCDSKKNDKVITKNIIIIFANQNLSCDVGIHLKQVMFIQIRNLLKRSFSNMFLKFYAMQNLLSNFFIKIFVCIRLIIIKKSNPINLTVTLYLFATIRNLKNQKKSVNS